MKNHTISNSMHPMNRCRECLFLVCSSGRESQVSKESSLKSSLRKDITCSIFPGK